MALVIIFITLALVVIAAIAITNTLLFPRLKPSKTTLASPKVSVLIPARNEAGVIAQTVERLLAQHYPTFEILVLDDDSSDNTVDVALAAGKSDVRLRVLRGETLPAGWMGKNWACHQLARAALGEWLIFTDADVIWSPDALEALIANAENTKADLLTIWPTQITESWSERLVVPLMSFAVMSYLPLLPVHHTRLPAFAAANGQCMAFRRDAYHKISGHAGVRNQIVEDVTLARRIKAHGLRLRMADGAGLISCRMYQNWSAVRNGFAKNILAGHGNSFPFLALSTLFHWLVFIFPWLWLFLGHGTSDWPVWPILLITLGLGARILTAMTTQQRITDSIFMPVSVFLLTVIAIQSVWWQARGGPRWKGRTINRIQGAAHG